MFSMQLFFAVACGLLVLNTDQAKAAVRQSGSTTYNQNQLILLAWLENGNATNILDKLIHLKPQLQQTENALSKAKDYLNDLLQERTTNRAETFKNTLDSELRGFFGSETCKGDSECEQTYGYVQQATGHIIGAILKETTIEEAKKNHIRVIIRENITEEGEIAGGASVLQTYEVAVKVWSCLRDFCKLN